MPINVSDAIDLDTGVIATLFDRVGVWADGLFVPGVETSRKAIISFQQPTPKELQFLKDGERTKDLKAMYINKKVVQTSENGTIEATEVMHRGKRYKVVFAGDWNDFGYMFAIGARI